MRGLHNCHAEFRHPGFHWKHALYLLATVFELQIRASIIAFDTAICVYGSCGEWQDAAGLLHESVAQGIETSVVNVKTAISACARCWCVALHLLAGAETSELPIGAMALLLR
ncbi:unnamed protein product [Durusdinium trenchii]|uniref:Pentatricopeptide repeat-containing protein n=1 Tax=Durusdinium trenchii TaxID=1381693 RepID=A0ABP0KRF0_9DINO